MSNDDPVEATENVDTDQWTQVHQARYERDQDGELATALVFAIADAKDADPLDRDAMPLLYHSIDAQALEETFFGPSGLDTQRKQTGAVNFEYDGHMVTLRADGWIFVYEPR